MIFPELKIKPSPFPEGSPKYELTGGLTKREYASLMLMIPSTGDDELDSLINNARRAHFAGLAMQGILSADDYKYAGETAEVAVSLADALLAELAKDEK